MRTGGRRFADTDVLVGMEGEKENVARSRAGSCVEFHNVKVRVFSAFSEGGILHSCLEKVLCASLVHTHLLWSKIPKRSMKASYHTLMTKLVNPALCLCWIQEIKSDFAVIGTWWAAVGGFASCCQMRNCFCSSLFSSWLPTSQEGNRSVLLLQREDGCV